MVILLRSCLGVCYIWYRQGKWERGEKKKNRRNRKCEEKTNRFSYVIWYIEKKKKTEYLMQLQFYLF